MAKVFTFAIMLPECHNKIYILKAILWTLDIEYPFTPIYVEAYCYIFFKKLKLKTPLRILKFVSLTFDNYLVEGINVINFVSFNQMNVLKNRVNF